jgi:hypothetical protein
MNFSIIQIKAILRLCPLEERLDLLTALTLNSCNDEVDRFCENYRWLLGAKDRKEQVANNERIQAIIDCAHKDASDEVDGEEGEGY